MLGLRQAIVTSTRRNPRYFPAWRTGASVTSHHRSDNLMIHNTGNQTATIGAPPRVVVVSGRMHHDGTISQQQQQQQFGMQYCGNGAVSYDLLASTTTIATRGLPIMIPMGHTTDEASTATATTSTSSNIAEWMMDCVAEVLEHSAVWMVSTLKRRRRKMNKHKLRKRRKKNRKKTKKV